MKTNKHAFTLIEIVITLVITSLLFLIIAWIYPYLNDTFQKQKENLEFQQSFVLDSFYLNGAVNNSFKILNNYYSWVFQRGNSYITLLNKPQEIHYSVIYLWDDNWDIQAQEKMKLNIKKIFLYSDFVKIADDMYFTNPGNHTIEKISLGNSKSEVVFWKEGISWYDNTWNWLFNTPTGITTDWENLYVSDSGNNLIRKIHLPSHTISVFAWIYNKSWWNENETSSAWTHRNEALFDYPTAIKFQAGNLYISDTLNNRIRKITGDSVYTLIGANKTWFNWDIGIAENILIHFPLSLEKISSWVIFGDIWNGKLRFLNEYTQEVKTIFWMETQQQVYWEFSRYNKSFYNTQIQAYWSWFYFNNWVEGVIYNYNFWPDNKIGTEDDSIFYTLGSGNKNLFSNGSFEKNDLNDIFFDDNEVFSISWGKDIYPIFWEKYLQIDTRGKTASWMIHFLSNPLDGDRVQIGDKKFEFDDDGIFQIETIPILLWQNIEETFANTIDEFQNYNISYQIISENKVKVFAKSIWNIWNQTPFMSTIDILPNAGTLLGGVDFWEEEYFDFQIKKLLEVWKKYRLSFYIWAENNILSEILSPVFIAEWLTFEEKFLNIYDKWAKKEFIIEGDGSDTIFFQFKKGYQFYIDNIELVAIDDIQDFSNLKDPLSIKLWLLQSFYIDENKYYFSDIENKKMYFLDSENLTSINDNFSFFDIKALKINLKYDYIWISIIDTLTFWLSNFTNIVYEIWKSDYLLKLSNNIKNYENYK